MIVVDTNLIVYLFLSGDRTPEAENVFRADPEWAAPLLWRSEFRNVLALYLHKKLITLEVACRIMEKATSMMYGRDYEMVSNNILSLAAASTCSAYDCEFAALARDLQVPLVSADQALQKQFPGVVVDPGQYLISKSSSSYG